MAKTEFEVTLAQRVSELNHALLAYLPGETGMQRELLAACNYSVENGGKRLRPLFLSLCYSLCGGEAARLSEDVLPFMAAIEMIHSSSLVHDDLPCMDNDRLRRGKPSTWAKFGEDMGTLAGDGLMIYAFETACKSKAPAKRKLAAIQILARKTGIFGMIGGQSVDVLLTGSRPSEDQLSYIYENKTGALLEASFMMGGVLAGAVEETVGKLEHAASRIGLAFQIQDDILDATASAEALGKTAGSDARNEKTTWLTEHGMEQSREMVGRCTEEAIALLEEVGSEPFLTALCRFLIHRSH